MYVLYPVMSLRAQIYLAEAICYFDIRYSLFNIRYFMFSVLRPLLPVVCFTQLSYLQSARVSYPIFPYRLARRFCFP
jgi:hypothetical protein